MHPRPETRRMVPRLGMPPRAVALTAILAVLTFAFTVGLPAVAEDSSVQSVQITVEAQARTVSVSRGQQSVDLTFGPISASDERPSALEPFGSEDSTRLSLNNPDTFGEARLSVKRESVGAQRSDLGGLRLRLSSRFEDVEWTGQQVDGSGTRLLAFVASGTTVVAADVRYIVFGTAPDTGGDIVSRLVFTLEDR